MGSNFFLQSNLIINNPKHNNNGALVKHIKKGNTKTKLMLER
jgi:hypothetical protein